MAEWLQSVSLRDGERLIIGPLGILVVPERPGPGDDSDLVQWAAILADAFAGNSFGIFSVGFDDELGELRIGIVFAESEVREDVDDAATPLARRLGLGDVPAPLFSAASGRRDRGGMSGPRVST